MLEAMSCGAPIAASNTSSMPELLGGLDATFDPSDPASIAGCLGTTLGSPDRLERLRRRSEKRSSHYTWTRVAEQTLEAYERAMPRPGRRRGHRARIALVTPGPPERSGVADYNRRLARELAALVDVDVVVAQVNDGHATPEPPMTLLGAGEFHLAHRLRQYDRIVYCIGNSLLNAHVLELLRTRPGAVVLHDVRLTGLYGSLAGRERPEDPAGWLVERMGTIYGSRLGLELTNQRVPDWTAQHALGLYMTGEVQSLADTVLVHSKFGRDVLRSTPACSIAALRSAWSHSGCLPSPRQAGSRTRQHP